MGSIIVMPSRMCTLKMLKIVKQYTTERRDENDINHDLEISRSQALRV
jgi:hypothetical protein